MCSMYLCVYVYMECMWGKGDAVATVLEIDQREREFPVATSHVKVSSRSDDGKSVKGWLKVPFKCFLPELYFLLYILLFLPIHHRRKKGNDDDDDDDGDFSSAQQ